MSAHHSINVVSARVGLTPDVIRVWERRYGAVKPERTATNRRLYSQDQIERLSLLRDVIQAGHSIGNVAALPTPTLRKLAVEKPAATLGASMSPFLDDGIAAVKKFDGPALDETLKRAAIDLGGQGVLQRVIAPLAQSIGDLWRDGTITAAHEHFASVVIRLFLGHAAKSFGGSEYSPTIVVATPTGQIHELGALLAAAGAAHLGWRVCYLGAGLPAAEIAGAAAQSRARAVALSLVYPEDDENLPKELSRLREFLPQTPLLVGGRASAAYWDALEAVDALQMKDLPHFCVTLDALRKLARKSRGLVLPGAAEKRGQ